MTQVSEILPKKRVVGTRILPSSAQILLAREIVNIGCHRLGHQFEETLLLSRLINLFAFLRSKK